MALFFMCWYGKRYCEVLRNKPNMYLVPFKYQCCIYSVVKAIYFNIKCFAV